MRASKPARLIQPKDAEEARRSQRAQLLTAKPVLYVCNVDEGEAADGNALSAAGLRESRGRRRRRRSSISAAIEAEIATLQPMSAKPSWPTSAFTKPASTA